MRLGLCRLLAVISGDVVCTPAESEGQGGLFDVSGEENRFLEPDKAGIALILALHSDTKFNFEDMPPHARRLFELSINAFEAIVHAWMSELPITGEIIRFGQKTLAAADRAKDTAMTPPALDTALRRAAESAAADRGDPDVRIVLEAAYKVWHEIHRLMGLLRFCPDKNGVYIARCEPDHGILPALGPHFMERFGQTPWAVIDEKRRLCMRRSGAPLEFFYTDNPAFLENAPDGACGGKWENLWRHYHKTINNESRNNPSLQRKFMPQRYWKYLTEL